MHFNGIGGLENLWAPSQYPPGPVRRIGPMQAKYYTRFLLKSGDPGFADEYTGVVELNQPANTVLDPQEIEAILAKNFNLEANDVELLNWSRVH